MACSYALVRGVVQSMRQILTIIRGNFRKNKGSYISIAVLMFVVAMSLSAVLSILINTGKRDQRLIEETGFGHIIAALKFPGEGIDYKEFVDKLVADVETCEGVGKVDKIPYWEMIIEDLNGKESNNALLIFDYQSEYLNYNIYDENHKKLDAPILNSGEIIVPISFKALYNCKVGDVITLSSEGKEYRYVIASYLEDPYMGSSMMGIKTVLFCKEDMEAVVAASERNEYGTVLSIFRDKESDMSDIAFEANLNKATSYAAYSWIAFSRSQVYSYMTLLTNIFAGVLMAFIVMLLVATMIVLGHNISNSIDHDYVNIGILKAVGMTDGRLKNSIMLGYIMAAFVGAVIGVPASVPIIGLVNTLTRPAIGIYVDNTPALLVVVFTILIIFLVLVLFIRMKLRKISQITPVTAMRGSKGDVHFSSLFKLPISKKGLSASLAYRQLVSGKKQYISAMIVTAILVLFMTMISDMCLWFGRDGKKLNEMFEPITYDITVWADNAEKLEDIDSIIKEYTEADRFVYGSKNIVMNDIQLWCGIIDDPEQISSVYKGRTCLYNNEVLITEYVAESFGIDIGDNVKIKMGDKAEEFIVSGYYQCSNDAGKNITINLSGFKRLVDEVNVSVYNYTLQNKDSIDAIIASVSEKYNEEEATVEEHTFFDGMEVVISAINGIAVLIYVIAAIFIIVTVVMVCGKIFGKEKQDYGIYKSLGYTSARLRRQFAVRFVFVAVSGSVIGIILTLLLSDSIIGVIFESFGIANFSADLHIGAAILPVVFMSLVYYVFAYIVSKKIKKVTPRILIAE